MAVWRYTALTCSVFVLSSYLTFTHAASDSPPLRLTDIPANSIIYQKLVNLSPEAQQRALNTLSSLGKIDYNSTVLSIDSLGGVIFIDTIPLSNYNVMPFYTPQSAEEDAKKALQAVPAGTDVFKLHSQPGAENVLYLDFKGETVTGKQWNIVNGYGAGTPRDTYEALPFDLDGDPKFNAEEQVRIYEIWRRVAEDYAPFNIDITTEEPPRSSFGARTGHAVITKSQDSLGRNLPGAALNASGIAFTNVWGIDSGDNKFSNGDLTFAYQQPAFIYYDKLLLSMDSKYNGLPTPVADTISHEIGHNLGLKHHGSPTVGADGYYAGHGEGKTGWAPIMGQGYAKNISQWSKGEYPAASNSSQDDLAVITGMNAAEQKKSVKLAYRSDDHGNTIADATPLKLDGVGTIKSIKFNEDSAANTKLDNKGIIERNTDVDFFKFTTTSVGKIEITATPETMAGVDYGQVTAYGDGSNLDIKLTLLDSEELQKAIDGNLPNDADLDATVTLENAPVGTYYLKIEGTGVGTNPAVSGYSDYGSLGQYFLSGNVPIAPPDTTPDNFAFTSQTGKAKGILTESNSIKVSGINTDTPISIIGGKYKINDGAYTATAGTVKNGDMVTVQHTTASEGEKNVETTLTIGEGSSGVSGKFISTTAADTVDTSPDDFSFDSKMDVALNTIVTSDPITISGIAEGNEATVSIVNGEYSIGGGEFTDEKGGIRSGQKITVRHTSASAPSSSKETTLTIGDKEKEGAKAAKFTTTTAAIDVVPNAFSFTAEENVALGAESVSNEITVAGIDASAASPISIIGGSYSINGTAFTTQEGTVKLNDKVKVKVMASSTPSTETSATLTIGGESADYKVTSEVADKTPNTVTFSPKKAVELANKIESETVTITGINQPVDVTITGGEYSIDGGNYTDVDGTIEQGQTIKVQHFSSSDFSTKTTTVLTIGSIRTEFQSTTKDFKATPGPENPDLNLASTAKEVLIRFAPIPVTQDNTKISISNGEFRILKTDIQAQEVNNQTNAACVANTWYKDNASCIAQQGDSVQVRHTSASTDGATVKTVVKLNDKEYLFESKTAAAKKDDDDKGFFGVGPVNPSILGLLLGLLAIRRFKK